jgi:hypothetical protein
VNILNQVELSAITFYSVPCACADRIAYCLWLCGKSFILLIIGITKLTAKIVSLEMLLLFAILFPRCMKLEKDRRHDDEHSSTRTCFFFTESVELFQMEDYLFTLHRYSGFLFCGQFIVREAHVT